MADKRGAVAKKTALVTGASGGIGKEFARILGREGYDLVLAARNEAALVDLAKELEREYGAASTVIPTDLAAPLAAEALFTKTGELGIAVDVLVNNAGFSVNGVFAETEPRSHRDMLELNVVALTSLTRLYLPAMVAKGSGGVINLASVGSFFPAPTMAGYCATKAYVLSFSEAIAEELAGTGVTVTALCPGPTKTGFASRAGIENSPMFRGRTLDARGVAELGYRGFTRGKRVVITGLGYKLMVFAGRFSPRGLIVKLAKRMMRSA